jgi:dihydroorotate dehydrogenase electron transfer subunit
MTEMKMTILSNTNVGKDTYLMKLKGEKEFTSLPGQFCEIKLDDFYLRRPISIFDQYKDTICFLYKVLGKGTLAMSKYLPGKELSILLNLGNGFDLSLSQKPLLIGGGIGVAPLYFLAKKLIEQGKQVSFLLGFKNKEEALMIKEFESLGKVYLVSDDGILGEKGNPVTYLKNHSIDFDYYYACGPLVMLKFLSKEEFQGCVSLEARMGCGFGACMGCSIRTTNGFRRVCKEGPVFSSKEVIYE